MTGGVGIGSAISQSKVLLFVPDSQLKEIVLVPDVWASYFGYLRGDDEEGIAIGLVNLYSTLKSKFGAVWIPEEGLAKAGKEGRRERAGERQIRTPTIPIQGSRPYQAARAAGQAMMETYGGMMVGRVQLFEVLKGIGDADGNLLVIMEALKKMGIPGITDSDLRSRDSPTTSSHLPYDDNDRIPLSEALAYLDLSKSGLLDFIDNDINFFSSRTSPSPPSVDRTPKFALPLSIDGDTVWGDFPAFARKVKVVPGGCVIELVENDKVWTTAGEEATKDFYKHRTSRLKSIKSKSQRLSVASSNPASLDGRVLGVSRKFTMEEGIQATAFATLQKGDFGGIKKGTRVGFKFLRRLHLSCRGDLGKIWETLRHHGLNESWCGGWDSFLFPLLRQAITLGATENPADLAEEVRLKNGQSNLKSGIFLSNSPVAAHQRRECIRQLRSRIPQLQQLSRTQPLSDALLDSQTVVMEALHLFKIIPRGGFERADPLSHTLPFDPASTRSGRDRVPANSNYRSATYPFGSGLLNAPIERPLLASRWTAVEYQLEGTEGLQFNLRNELARRGGATVVWSRINGDADESEDGSDASDEDEDEDEDEDQNEDENEDEEKTPFKGTGSATRFVTVSRAKAERHQQNLLELKRLIAQPLPSLSGHLDNLDTLANRMLEHVLTFFDISEAASAFEVLDESDEVVLHHAKLVELVHTLIPGRVSEIVRPSEMVLGVSTVASRLGVRMVDDVHYRLNRIIASGGLNSPALNHSTLVPLLVNWRPRVDVTANQICQFLHLTSRLKSEWTSNSSPPLDKIKAILLPSSDRTPPFLRSDGEQLKRDISAIRRLSRVFEIAPPPFLNSFKRPSSPRPNIDETRLRTGLAPVLDIAPDKRYQVSITVLRDAIGALGGRLDIARELGVGLTGGIGVGAPSEDDINLQYERKKHCWRWLEAVTVATVGEARLEEIFVRLIDWEESDRLKYIVSETK